MKSITLLFTCSFVLLSPALEARRVYIEERPVIIAEQTPPAQVVVVDTEPALVQEAPPEPKVEVMTTCPSSNHVWIGGYWKWEGRWVWECGCWKPRPHPTACWEPGHWSKHHTYRGWVWVPGHWR